MTDWLTLDEVATSLVLNKETVRLMAVRGDLPGARKWAGQWRVPPAAIKPDTTPKPLITPPSRRSMAQQRRRTA